MRQLLPSSLILLVLLLLSVQSTAAEEAEIETKKAEVRKGEEKQKRISVFEIVNKFLTVNVSVSGKRLTKEERADISGKVESSIKDCFAKVLMEHEDYQKREKRLFKSDSIVKVKLSQGVFTNIKVVSSKGRSPIIKECINSLRDLEAGFNTTTDITLKVHTRLR